VADCVFITTPIYDNPYSANRMAMGTLTRCQTHSYEMQYTMTNFGMRCPIGQLEEKIEQLEARLDSHEQNYYNAQYPKNVRSG